MKIFLVFLVFFASNSLALDDNLLKSIEISAHGNRFQSERLKIASENLANEDSTSTQPGGSPYQRKVVFAKNVYDKKVKAKLVRVRKYDYDKRPFKIKYDPYHPAADEEGYVKLPNVEKIIEKADAMEAQRSYEANLGMIELSKQMIDRTIDAMR
ncbi:MAG: flagellar basal body rod protein FlgC [Rickettsiaceae bacterium]|nr:flagellar basal body rod protein FlgC [Rickettsiaceae bacterium]